MNHANHEKIITLAIPTLPSGSRDFWTPLSRYMLETCMLPDQIAIPLLNGETGTWRHYFPANVPLHSFQKLGAAARSHFFDHRFFIDHIMDLVGRGELVEASRFLGVFAHHLGDFGEPAHYYEHEITLLVPPPADRVNCNSHRMIEDTASTVTSMRHVPAVLGDTAASISMRFEGRLRELYETSLGAIVPMLSALYRRDGAAAGRLVDPVVTTTAAIMADMLHSLWCLHSGEWTLAERQALAVCRLEDMEPAAYDVEFNYGCRPMRKAVTPDQLGRALPLQTRIDAAGTIQAVTGLCTVPHALPIKGTSYRSSLDYDLPPDTFDRFTCRAGLLAGYQPQAVCRFVVLADGVAVHESSPMRVTDPAVPINASIAGCRRLSLVVMTDGSTDKLAMPIWCEPLLLRTKEVK